MNSPLLHVLHMEAKRALRQMYEMPFENLNLEEHYAFLCGQLDGLATALDQLAGKAHEVELMQPMWTDLRRAGQLLSECIDGYPPTKEKMGQALSLIGLWLPKGGA